MRQDLAVRAKVREKLRELATQMSSWEILPRVDAHEAQRIKEAIQPFAHTTTCKQDLIVCGVDGTGDFPALSYGDSFVYVTLAQGTRYRGHAGSGLKEVAPELEPVIEFTWLPEDDAVARSAYEAAFTRLAGRNILDVIRKSDYRMLKKSGSSTSLDDLVAGLVRPHATDTGNVAIQLRSTAELGAALRLITAEPSPSYVLMDSTLSLPFVNRAQLSLFFEHLKRLCCVEALQRGTGFFALSKSHGLPAIENVERLAAESLGLGEEERAEHWYLRLPDKSHDGWELSLVENRSVPPVGAVTYLVKFHKNTPVMRLDMDEGYWQQFVEHDDLQMMRARERQMFEDLDYASHDQRAYGYPYPIKAGHDRASLTNAERIALRKLIMDAAVAEGMRPQLFRNVSKATGHG